MIFGIRERLLGRFGHESILAKETAILTKAETQLA
jgi:hypothetical protein